MGMIDLLKVDLLVEMDACNVVSILCKIDMVWDINAASFIVLFNWLDQVVLIIFWVHQNGLQLISSIMKTMYRVLWPGPFFWGFLLFL